MEVDDVKDIYRVNMLSCFLALQHGSRVMKESSSRASEGGAGGTIILTASVAGIRSGAGGIDYSGA